MVKRRYGRMKYKYVKIYNAKEYIEKHVKAGYDINIYIKRLIKYTIKWIKKLSMLKAALWKEDGKKKMS